MHATYQNLLRRAGELLAVTAGVAGLIATLPAAQAQDGDEDRRQGWHRWRPESGDRVGQVKGGSPVALGLAEARLDPCRDVLVGTRPADAGTEDAENEERP